MQQITSFASSEKGLFVDAKVREQTEHNYGFSGQSIEEFSALIENKLDSLASFEEQAKVIKKAATAKA